MTIRQVSFIMFGIGFLILLFMKLVLRSAPETCLAQDIRGYICGVVFIAANKKFYVEPVE